MPKQAGDTGQIAWVNSVDTTLATQVATNAAKLNTADLDAATATVDANAASAYRVQADARQNATIVASQLGRPSTAQATQGLYSRVAYSSFRVLAKDPTVAGRVWGVSSGGISYMDGDGSGARFDVGAMPTTQSGVQMEFTGTHVFLVTSGNASLLGQVWRSPLPAADGSGLVWTKIFDLTGFTTSVAGGVNGGVGSYFREQSFATNGTIAYILEYGGIITGGPSVYYTANVQATSMLWSKRKTFVNGKHGHGIAIINGLPWLQIGDAGYSDLGIWRATDPPAGTWNQQSLYGEALGGNTHYGINLHPVTIGGVNMIMTDADGKRGLSVLLYPTQGGAQLALMPLLGVYAPYFGTTRGLKMTSEGNLFWVTTGENGSVGPLDSLWTAKAPYTEPILLESIPSVNTLGTIGYTVESGDYLFVGPFRIRKEKFAGQ